MGLRLIQALTLGLVLAHGSIAEAEIVQLTTPVGRVNDHFGTAIAVDADTLIVGAPSFERQGAAYVYGRSAGRWKLMQTLKARDGAVGDLFGISIALDGNAALIGATRAPFPGDYFRGAAYAFERVGGRWVQRQRLNPSTGYMWDWFGGAVALSGDTAVVGSRQEHGDPGAAFIFRHEGGAWVESQRIDGADFEQLGSSVAIDGDTAVIGGPNADTYAGAAYVYVSDGDDFVLEQRLVSSTPAIFVGHFGASVAIDGDTVAVGSTGDSGIDAAAQFGAAYVFTRAGDVWSEHQKLVGSQGHLDKFGSALALRGGWLIVGAPGETVSSSEGRGAAYVFSRNTAASWSRVSRRLALGGAAGDAFGDGIAYDGRTLAIGAAFDDVFGRADQGSVYVSR